MTKEKSILGLVILVIFIVAFSLYPTFYYASLYHKAIQHGAENVVTVLEMVVACQVVGNVSVEETRDKWVEMFLLNRTMVEE